MPGRCHFNEKWLEKDGYKTWLRKDDKNPNKAFCFACKKSIDLNVMGESALVSHMKGKKHEEYVKSLQSNEKTTKISNFLALQQAQRWHNQLEIVESKQQKHRKWPLELAPAKQASHSIQSLLGGNATLKAETLKVITSHYSLKSCEGINGIFNFKFPDSDIAKHFACGERKAACLSTFGIAPHFLSLLKGKVRDQFEYVLLFDESLNSEMQSKQLDVLVRYWNADKVELRYFTSYFLGHADAEAVPDKFESVCGDLGYEKLAQLSMDGSNVNWKVFRLMQEDVQKQTGKKLLNVGSCGLHVIHNSSRDGCSAAEWDVETFLISVRWLFKDSPARCEDYTSVTGSNSFPLDFCRHCWLENVPVVERALEIIPFVVQYITAAKSGKVTEPKNKSFENVQQSVKGPLLTAKLNFFLMNAREIQLSTKLTKYQADKPLLPFFATEMKNLVKELMQKFIKPDLLSDATSVVKLLKIEYEKFPNHVDLSKVKIEFAAERILCELKGSKKLSERQVFEFRMSCKAFLIKMGKKILDKSPLTYPLYCKERNIC